MKHVVNMSWIDKVAFEADVQGHKIVVDISADEGGSDLGPSPKRMMLIALAGCTGMDVIMLLHKMKVFPEAFDVAVEGTVADEHPKRYTGMKIVYLFKGSNLPMDMLEKAVKLSTTKYCGVNAVYRKAMDITTEIRIVGE